MDSIRIVSIASSIPPRVVSNEELSEIVDTDDEWIKTRTGIERRHFASEETTNADQAIAAGRKALDRAGIAYGDIDALIVTTFTPDTRAPATAAHVHSGLGLRADAMTFDINGACAGFIYSLHVARALMMQAGGGKMLVIGSELISKILDFTDRSTCVLFGDGAAAAVVELAPDKPYHFISGTEGDSKTIICRASCYPDAVPGVSMRGQEVFRFACESIENDIYELVKRAGLELADIDHVVCHQANARIIRHVEKRVHARKGQFFMDVAEYGNTSAASIPIALADMYDQGLLKRGDKLILVGFGAGLVQGGVLFEW